MGKQTAALLPCGMTEAKMITKDYDLDTEKLIRTVFREARSLTHQPKGIIDAITSPPYNDLNVVSQPQGEFTKQTPCKDTPVSDCKRLRSIR